MVGRFLVTSAVEETWPANRPILFLGEWCRRYDRRGWWESLDAEVMPYHWDDREKLFGDYKYLVSLHEVLLEELSGQLNRIHGVCHTIRYWRILIGPWLGYFVQMLFDRWTMLQNAIHVHHISEANIVDRDPLDFIPNDMGQFRSLLISDEWNEVIMAELLCGLGVSINRVSPAGDLPQRTTEKHQSYLKKQFWGLSEKWSRITSAKADHFFFFFCLSRSQSLRLQWQLGQLPQLWRPVPAPIVSASKAQRQVDEELSLQNADFPSVARAMVMRHIPLLYLEGYAKLTDLTKSLPWPQRPKSIFTTNIITDDVFKAWTASQTESGTPLIIGQHGGNYGLARWNFEEEHEISVADRFLSWGWTDQTQAKVVPVGNIKGFGVAVDSKKDGGALLVTMTLPRMSYMLYSTPIAHQWTSYFEDQCRFVKSLPPDIREQLVVRLYSLDYGWSQLKRWKEKFPSIRIDDGAGPIVNSIVESRVFISTYNATTYLESLSLNIPTIIFWNEKYWELRSLPADPFEQLRAAGIFHDNPESAAKHLASVWHDIESWWRSSPTQAARRSLCDKYAVIPQQPIQEMKKVFES